MCYKNMFTVDQPQVSATTPGSAAGGMALGSASSLESPFYYNPELDFYGSSIFGGPLEEQTVQNTSPMSFSSEYSPPPSATRGGKYCTAPLGGQSASTYSFHQQPQQFGTPVYNGFASPPEYAYQHNNGTAHPMPTFLQLMQGLDLVTDQYSPDADLDVKGFAMAPSTLATSPLSAQQQSSLCKVCGDVASGNHFGVLSCEACKSFFRRSVRAGARYACRGTRTCSVEKHTRNRCQYCRLQKCIQMGMRKEAVQEERAPPVTKIQRAGTPTQLGYSSPNTVMGSSIPHIPPMPSSYHRMFESPVSPVVPSNLMTGRMFGSLPNLKMGLELESQPLTPPMHLPPVDPYGGGSRPSTPNGAMPTVPSYTDAVSGHAPMTQNSTQVSASVLVNAELQTDIPPETITMSEKSVKLEDIFEGARQSLLRVIEWGKRIPAFTTLGLDDQVKLLKSCWCEHVLLKLSTRIGARSETLLLSSGITCRKDQIEDPEVRRIVERIAHEISYWFDVMHVDRVEMACLKGIILFNPDARGLSPGTRKRVEIFQEQILQALETRCKTMYPVTPLRFSKLLLRLPPLRAAALEATQHMEVQRTLGNTKIDNIFGELLDFD